MRLQHESLTAASPTTGIPALDACLAGPRAGEVMLVAGDGAADAALAIAISAARADQPTFFFSRRLDERGFRARVIAALARMPVGEALDLSGRRARAIDKAALERIDLPLYRGEQAWETARDIAAQVAPAWYLEGAPLVVVDDVSGLRDGGGSRRGAGGTGGMRAVAAGLAHAARVLDAAVIACVPTDDGSRRSAEAACCLSMLADEVLLSRMECDGREASISLVADRVRGDERAVIELAPEGGGAAGDPGAEEGWDAFALRESA